MSQWPETSESLILRIRDPQDALAWSQFMTIYRPIVYRPIIYRPIVYRLSRRRGLQHVDADDLCQQIYMSVAKAVDSWEAQAGGPRFRNWLGRITRNAILNALTRTKPDRATGTSSVQDLLLDVANGGDMATALLAESRMEAYRWAAKRVQSTMRSTVVMRVKPFFTRMKILLPSSE